MPEAIIVALISLIGIIISNIVTAVVTMNKQNVERKEFAQQLYNELDKRSELSDAGLRKEIAVIMEQLDSLRSEVARHNLLLERLGKIEQNLAVNASEIKSLRQHLNDLERVVNK